MMDFYNMAKAYADQEKVRKLTGSERLLKLIYEGLHEMQSTIGMINSGYGILADYLMDNGVIALPEEDDGGWIPADVAEPEPDLFVLVSVS